MEDKIISQSKQNSLYTINNRPLRRLTNEKKWLHESFPVRKDSVIVFG